MSQQFYSCVYTPKIKNRDLNGYVYASVHSSIIPNSQKVERAQVSIKR